MVGTSNPTFYECQEKDIYCKGKQCYQHFRVTHLVAMRQKNFAFRRMSAPSIICLRDCFVLPHCGCICLSLLKGCKKLGNFTASEWILQTLWYQRLKRCAGGPLWGTLLSSSKDSRAEKPIANSWTATCVCIHQFPFPSRGLQRCNRSSSL